MYKVRARINSITTSFSLLLNLIKGITIKENLGPLVHDFIHADF